jgi:hypothetical protein
MNTRAAHVGFSVLVGHSASSVLDINAPNMAFLSGLSEMGVKYIVLIGFSGLTSQTGLTRSRQS